MERTIEAEIETKCKNSKTAIDRFITKYPELHYWREELEYMADNGQDFECNNVMGDGSKNNEWTYAIHFDNNDGSYYICVIERA